MNMLRIFAFKHPKSVFGMRMHRSLNDLLIQIEVTWIAGGTSLECLMVQSFRHYLKTYNSKAESSFNLFSALFIVIFLCSKDSENTHTHTHIKFERIAMDASHLKRLAICLIYQHKFCVSSIKWRRSYVAQIKFHEINISRFQWFDKIKFISSTKTNYVPAWTFSLLFHFAMGNCKPST